MKKFLVWDSGLYSSLAASLSRGGNSVSYFTPFHASFFPLYPDYAIGKGFDLQKVMYFFDEIDKSDCIVNFDVGFNDLMAFLKKKLPGKPVFGSGRAEKLENNRWGLKKIIKQLGLPVQHSVKLHGVHALCDYIQKNPDKYVKVDVFRGTIRSFYAKDYKSVELLMEDWEDKLGVFSEEFDFVVEDAIHESQEWGYDGFFWGSDYVKPYFFGVELEKDAYIGRVSNELPKQLKETMDKFRPVFQELDYRGCISTEEKITKGKHYFLDICARAPNPCGLAYPFVIENWPEVVYAIASKKEVKIQTKYKYFGAVPVYSKHVKNNWVKVNFPDSIKDNVKFMTAAKKGNDYVAVENSPEEVACVVVDGANSINELVKNLKDKVSKIDVYESDKNAVYGLDKIKDIISEAKSIGIDF